MSRANGRAPLDVAQEYLAAGLSVIPIRADGSKAPTKSWREFQDRLPTDDELRRNFLADNIGLAIVHGAVSGGTELIDMDNAELASDYRAALDAVAPGLIRKVCIISTPRPGFHLVYRCSEIDGNQKLAQDEGGETLIETRGQGGYAIAPGSPPECHPTGRTYDHRSGPSLLELPTITPEERKTLLDVARSFNRFVDGSDEPGGNATHSPNGSHRDGLSPGDDYNQRTTWQDILAPHGWSEVFTSGDVTHWRRPGKTSGTSATTGLRSKNDAELLCVFSSNAAPFDGPGNGRSCSTHSKFDAYARLHHGGDYSAAARQLGSAGYGDRPAERGGPAPDPPDPPEDDNPFRSAPDLEPYAPVPISSLPPVIGDYVSAAATAIGCDAAFILLPLVACLSRAIGNSRVIRLKRTWVEPAIIWAAIVGKSGTHKTPAIQAATAALQEKQKESLQGFSESIRQHEVEQAHYQKELAEWKRKKTDDQPPWEPQPPVCERFITSDATIEAIAERLADQFHGLLVVRDELAGWILGIAEYKGGRGSDLGHWLAMWSGAPLTVDRKTGQKKLIHCDRAAVSLVGGIQPGTLREAIGREHMQDGLCARLLMAMPDARPVQWTEDVIAPEIEHKIAEVFNLLLALEPAADADGNPEPFVLDMSPEAKALWVEYYNRHRGELAGLDDDLAAAWSKLEAYTARLALIFELSIWAAGDAAAGNQISEASMAAAIALTDWFGGEAKRVYGMMAEDRDQQQYRELVELIQRKGSRITARELCQSSRRHRPVEAAEAALDQLAKAGFGRWTVTPTKTKQRREFILSTASTYTD